MQPVAPVTRSQNPIGLHQPKPLKVLAQEKIEEVFKFSPLRGSGVPFVVTPKSLSLHVATLIGTQQLRAYMCTPTVCQLFKDVQIEKPRIALVAYYLDQLGDIRILLNARLIIKERFGVEPTIIASQEDIKRTRNYLGYSSEMKGLTFVDIDEVRPSDCLDLDLLIHGPAIHYTESHQPESILSRYPKLKASMDSKNPPAVFSLLESECGNFSYSLPSDDGYKSNLALQATLKGIKNLRTHRKANGISEENRNYIHWNIPLMLASAESFSRADAKISRIYLKLAMLYQGLPVTFNAKRYDEDLKQMETVLTKVVTDNRNQLRKRIDFAKRIGNVPDPEISRGTIPKKTESTGVKLVEEVSGIYELQIGLTPLFSIGSFKLSGDLQKWKSSGKIATAAGRKWIFDHIQGMMTPQETGLLIALERKSPYVFGYAHEATIKKEFVDQAFQANPEIKNAVINMSLNEAYNIFQNYNLIDHASGFEVVKGSDRTVHLYSKLSPYIFDGLMAASDPSCRLAGGDNTFFTTFMLGTDDLFYELRPFKIGMILALFNLANELTEQEKNCIVDRMLETASPGIMLNLKDVVPVEYAAYVERKKTNQLSVPGSTTYSQAFRKIGRMIEQRAEQISDNLAGFMKMRILKRRNPRLFAEIADEVKDGAPFKDPASLSRVKSKLAVQI